jgi:non-specific serine/threonine protein kinase/serine/threonine-protein kinase
VTLLAGRYELGPVVGRGGMGEVRAGSDRRLGRPVAVKILRSDLAERPDFRRRFDTEARAAGRLTHPNIVTVLDRGEYHGRAYLVMERLPGRSLTDELREGGPVSTERALELARDILAALAVAHDAGIVHRDVKPGNVLLTADGQAKVADFGIAKIAEADDRTVTTELLATPAYVAPERLAGHPASPRSDVYSVGVLLYEALAGRRPFAGDTHVAQLHAIEEGSYVPLRALRRGLPDRVYDAIDRAMARDPDARFGSATEMADALLGSVAASETVPVPAPSDDDDTRGATRSGSHLTRTRELRAPPSRKRVSGPRSRRWPAALAGIGVVLVIGIAAGFALERTGGNNGQPASGVPPTSASVAASPPPAGVSALPPALDRSITRLETAIDR